MTNTKLPHVNAGDRVKPVLRASTWNAFTDAANWIKRHRNANRENAPRGVAQEPPSVCWAINADDSYQKNHVVGLDFYGTEVSDIADRLKLPIEVLVPDGASHFGKFGIMRDAIPTEEDYADCTVSGIAHCRLFVESNGAWITRADIESANKTRLITHPGGSAQIIWKDETVGTDNVETDAIVRLGTPQNVTMLGVVSNGGPITAGGSGTVRLWRSNLVDTLYNVTARLDWMHNAQNVSDAKQVLLTWFPLERIWRIVGAECE